MYSTVQYSASFQLDLQQLERVIGDTPCSRLPAACPIFPLSNAVQTIPVNVAVLACSASLCRGEPIPMRIHGNKQERVHSEVVRYD